MVHSNKYIIRFFWIICFSGTMVTSVMAQERYENLLQQYTRNNSDTNRTGFHKQLSPIYLLKPGENQTNHVNIVKDPGDVNRIKGMLQTVYHKRIVPNITKAEFDSLISYSEQAMALSMRIGNKDLVEESRLCLAHCYLLVNADENGKQKLLNAFDYFSSEGKIQQALELSYIIGLQFKPGNPEYERAKLFRAKLFSECKEPREKLEMKKTELRYAKQWAALAVNLIHNFRMDEVEEIYTKVFDFFTGNELLQVIRFYMYSNVALVNYYKGNYPKALSYGLQAIELIDQVDSKNMTEVPYLEVAIIYFEHGNMQESVAYFQKAFEEMNRSGRHPTGTLFKGITRSFIKWDKPQEALAFIEKNTMRDSVFNILDRIYIFESKGLCFLAMGIYDKAEAYFLKNLEAANKLQYADKNVLYLDLARLYTKSNQFNKASVYLDSLASQEGKTLLPLASQEELALMRFRVDSAKGRYPDAIKHLQQNKLLHDYVFNETKNKQFEELMIQYETEKKNKNIELLIKQSLLQASQLKQERLQFRYESEIKKHELKQAAYESNKKDNELKIAQYETEKKNNDLKTKEQNIQLLHKQDQLKTTALQKTTQLRNVFIAGAIILLFLLGVIYIRYRQNKKTTRLLKVQQEIINQTNHELQQLNDRQFKLLLEKEWLVKEIHHRVKNNLQMMISLLNTQAEFINNPSALHAIQESRERMQAIAILHKKLYQLQNTTKISMRSYITELVENIKNSVGGSRQFFIEMDIANVQMDVSQSVPLGLIINEAITNAIKYAYPDNEKGRIYISLTYTSRDQMQLKIADNGQGLPAGMDAGQSNTLGLQLIKIFSEQLEGDLHFINHNGLEIALNFKTDKYSSTIINRDIV